MEAAGGGAGLLTHGSTDQYYYYASAATESRGVGEGEMAARWRMTFVGTWDIVGFVPPKFE